MNTVKRKNEKHTQAEKLSAVRMVLDGMDHSEVSRLTGVNRRLLGLWIELYSKHGVDGLSLKNGPYSTDFKAFILRDLLENNLSLNAAAVKYMISPSVISRWRSCHNNPSISGLNKPRKRPPKHTMSKKTSPKKPLTREQELEEENAYLRAENAYLKKLRALVEERIARDREIGREPSKH